jgi:mannosyltransferase
MTNFDFIRDKTEVMPNAVDTERFAAGHSVRAELGLTADDVVVGTLAQLRKGKGIDLLMDAALELLPRHPRLVFLVAGRIGDGEEEFGHALKARAQRPEYEGRFRFLGSRQDVPDLLATFDVFVLPTLAETFGIAVVEAMAAGIPVIASRIAAIEEIITSPEQGRVVAPLTAPAFATAIDEIISRPDRGRALGRAGQQSLVGRFDRATLAARIHRIYDQL